MVSVALDPAHRRLSVEEFLAMDFGDGRAELVNGVVFMMAGGNNVHNRVAANVLASLWNRLDGSSCRPYGPDQGVLTEQDTTRYPDVSVYCGDMANDEYNEAVFLGDPKVVFEVFSTSTMDYDQRHKLGEYQALSGVECIVMIEPNNGRIRLVERTGPHEWYDRWWTQDDGDLPIACLGITLPRREIFRP